MNEVNAQLKTHINDSKKKQKTVQDSLKKSNGNTGQSQKQVVLPVKQAARKESSSSSDLSMDESDLEERDADLKKEMQQRQTALLKTLDSDSDDSSEIEDVVVP